MAEIDLDYYRGIVTDYRNHGHWVGVSDDEIDDLVAEIAELRAKLERSSADDPTHAHAIGKVNRWMATQGGIPSSVRAVLEKDLPALLVELGQARSEVARLRADVKALADEVATLTGERDDALLTIQSMNHGDPQ